MTRTDTEAGGGEDGKREPFNSTSGILEKPQGGRRESLCDLGFRSIRIPYLTRRGYFVALMAVLAGEFRKGRDRPSLSSPA
jgi:hypothetical protein